MKALRLALLLTMLIVTSEYLRAEWITLQVPLGRTGHTFSLWEVDETTPTGAGGSLQFPGQDSTILFVDTPAEIVAFVGGSFNASGTWVPDSQSYMTIQVQRQRPGSHFWLKDENNGQFGSRDQVGLVDAYWRNPQALNQTPLWFFSLPEDFKGDILGMLSPSTGALTYVTQGAIQGEYSADGQSFTSYGFLEAWSFAYQSTTQGFQFVNFTKSQMVVNPAFNLVDPYQWVPFTGNLPVHDVAFIVPDSSEYYLYVEGAPQAYYPSYGDLSWDGNTYYSVYYIQATVGQYCDFALERARDEFRVDGFSMWDSPQMHDVTSSFPPPHYQNWSEMSFQFLGSYHPANAQIRYIDGSSSSIGYYYDSSLTYWDEYGNQGTVPVYDAYATVDTGQEWWMVVDGVALGQGPGFSNVQWPAIWNSSQATGSINLALPVVRQNHGLLLNDGNTWRLTSDSTSYPGTVGGYLGPNGEWVSWDVFFATAPIGQTSGSTSIHDESSGDTLSGSGYTFAREPAFWFPKHSLVLKISGTRWGNDLRIRTGSGSEYSITRNKMQGTWTLDSTGKAWFNGYGFFDASSTAEQGVPWWLVDYSRMGENGPEVLTSSGGDPLNFINSTDNKDSDDDGLADWYERFIGTDPNNPDTDGDGIADGSDPAPRTLAVSASSTLKVWTPLR